MTIDYTALWEDTLKTAPAGQMPRCFGEAVLAASRAGVDCDAHNEIMNLPCKPYDGTDAYTHYCKGHRDARHAAALIASEVHASLLARLDAAESALNRIASWPEGEQVGPTFDEPHAARIARDALNSVSDAEGAQTSPIPCDVFAGGSLFKKGTPFCDLAEHIETEGARLVWAMHHMGMSNEYSRDFGIHVMRVGGMGDIHDCRTFIDAALTQGA